MALETLIDAATLMKLLAGNRAPVVVDCRFELADPDAGRRQFQAGHIPGARFADLNTDLSSEPGPRSGRHPLPAPAALALALARFGIAPDSQVVAYDAANGAFAARLWWLLRWVGHRAVAVLDGGLSAWAAAGGGLSTTVPGAASLPAYPVAPQEGMLADLTEVAANIGSGAHLLIDARAVERYAGEVEPIDTLAGHVPGALNAPFSASLAPDGRFLPRDALRALWGGPLAGRDPAQVIAMCGSGVTACHDLLSLEVAGLGGARLYAGSWSEWIRDPARPVAKGRAP